MKICARVSGLVARAFAWPAGVRQVWAAVMTPEQMRAAYPLISTSPNYGRYLEAKAKREANERIVSRLMSPWTFVGRFIRIYIQTFTEVIDPPGADLHIGPGK